MALNCRINGNQLRGLVMMGICCLRIATLYSRDYDPFHGGICTRNENINAGIDRSLMASIIITVQCVGKYGIRKESEGIYLLPWIH